MSRMVLFSAALLSLLASTGAAGDEANFKPIFDGKTFAGWEGDTKTTFRIEDGAVVAGNMKEKVPRNEFLCTTKEYGDFELRLKFKVLGQGANAGVQIRSRRIPDHHEMIGYQADLGQGWYGCLYDESRRRIMLAEADPKLIAEVVKADDWNEYVIRCQGKRIQLSINGKKTVDYTEPDDAIEQRGLIGLQIHGGPPSEAWYKDIVIAELGPAAGDDAEFRPIFDGETLAGWHISGKTGHGTGGRWVVEDGMIVGSQDKPGNGGIIITDKKYGDFEVSLEMKNDFVPDSGLFLRSSEDGHAYQAMIDYHSGGNLMGIYGEGLSGGISVRNFDFGSVVTEIKPVDCPFPLPVSPEKWPEFWQHGKWNTLRARIVGNPPHITTWINDVKFMEWSDRDKRHPDSGGIALQVHGGGDTTREFVRYRNVRVKELSGE
ncbi:MAG TPA: DUF1080 domain-containing protein [Pirellulales bacterium]|nr:DUF1080 domain-containing protein [Pirellulales bacterium]